MQDIKKWVHLSFLGCGALAWAFLREIFSLVFEWVSFRRPTWVISPADLLAIVSGLVLFLVFVRSEKIVHFVTEALNELIKVTWPQRKETILSAGVVSIMVAIATICVLSLDSLWRWFADRFIYF